MIRSACCGVRVKVEDFVGEVCVDCPACGEPEEVKVAVRALEAVEEWAEGRVKNWTRLRDMPGQPGAVTEILDPTAIRCFEQCLQIVREEKRKAYNGAFCWG